MLYREGGLPRNTQIHMLISVLFFLLLWSLGFRLCFHHFSLDEFTNPLMFYINLLIKHIYQSLNFSLSHCQL